MEDLNKCFAGAPGGHNSLQVVEIRGDMLEFIQNHGFCHYGGKKFCCFFCDASPDARYALDMIGKWHETSDQEYRDWVLNVGARNNRHRFPSPFATYALFTLKMYTVDWMHTVDLGLCHYYISLAVDYLLRQGWPEISGGVASETRSLRLSRLNSNLRDYYKASPRKLTQVGQLKLAAVGKRLLRLKAAEARDLLPFILQQIAKFPAINGNIAEAGRALGDLCDIFKDQPQEIGEEIQTAAMVLLVRHMHHFREAGGRLVPKHHYLVHCLAKLHITGNPLYNYVYMDEHYNGVAKKAGRNIKCHLAFSKNVLKKLLLQNDLARLHQERTTC